MVRYVVGGVLFEMLPPPRHLYREFTEDLEARFGIWGVKEKKVGEGLDKTEREEEVVRLRKFDSGDFISATTRFPSNEFRRICNKRFFGWRIVVS